MVWGRPGCVPGVVGRRRPVATILACWLVATSGCGEAPTNAVPVFVSDSAGTPVYTLESLPRWDDPRYRWTLEVERSIYTGSDDPLDPPLLYRPRGLTRLPDGRLVVLDADEPLLVVLSGDEADERLVERRFARRGQGPGELMSSNAQLWPAGDDALWVFDAGNQRLSRFSASGDLEEERALVMGGNGGVAMLRPSDHSVFVWRVFMPDPETGELVDSVGRFDPDADHVDFIAPMAPRPEARSRNTSPIALFFPKSWFAPVRAGVIVGRSDSGRFRHYDDEGRLLGIIDVPMERSPVPGDAEGEILEEFLGVSRGSTLRSRPVISEEYPLYNLLLPVDDTLFALQQGVRSRPLGEDDLPDFVWRVFSTRGSYAGTIVLPEGTALPFWIEPGRIVGVRADSLGVASIESYRVEPPRTGAKER